MTMGPLDGVRLLYLRNERNANVFYKYYSIILLVT